MDKIISFADGLLQPIEVENGCITKTLGHVMPYGIRTLGMARYYAAAQAGVEISRLVAVPFESHIDKAYLLELREFRSGDVQRYSVEQVQELPDTMPPCKTLTLKELRTSYKDKRPDAERLGSL